MTTTIKMSGIKRFQSRATTYSYKSLVKVFEQLGWEHKVVPPATQIVHFQKSFANDQEAIKGRKELETSLKLVHRNVSYRLESIERS